MASLTCVNRKKAFPLDRPSFEALLKLFSFRDFSCCAVSTETKILIIFKADETAFERNYAGIKRSVLKKHGKSAPIDPADFAVSISSGTDSAHFFQAFRQVSLTERYFSFFGYAGILSFDEIDRPPFLLEKEIFPAKKLQMQIKTGQFSSAMSLLQGVFEPYLNQRMDIITISALQARYFEAEIFSFFLKLIENTPLKNADFLNGFQSELISARTLGAFYSLSENIMLKLSQSDDPPKSKNFRIADITQYIKGSLSNPYLSLGDISDKFHYSSAYLSRKFKKEMNITVIRYIQSQRIEQAKWYLSNTNDSITKIVKRTGFSSDENFIRTFKKLEHITPGAYRILQPSGRQSTT